MIDLLSNGNKYFNLVSFSNNQNIYQAADWHCIDKYLGMNIIRIETQAHTQLSGHTERNILKMREKFMLQ